MTRANERFDRTLSVEALERIDEICGEFEDAWRRGREPRAVAYVDRLEGREQQELRRQIVLLEQDLRDGRARSSIVEHTRYRLVSEVGRGAMGVVYVGIHKALEKRVAVKILLPHVSDRRFRREARILARIRSPHVVAVHDFDILSNGQPMIVMEWIDGGDLGGTIQAAGGRLDEERAISLMKETCLGMAAAADEGIVHRDLKPSNILLDSSGHAHVADFGLARGPVTAGELSQTGQIMGTVHYMSPEQAEDPRRADSRSDIYSFGATFYQALTGRVPFDGETPFGILYKHKTEALASPRSVNPQLSKRVSELLERCLAKSPADRFQSFDETRAQLDASSRSPWDFALDEAVERYLERYRDGREVYLGDPASLDEGDTYVFPGGRTLTIAAGDIVNQEVDAIVSSDEYLLPMDEGVALAIRRAAGHDMVAEATKYAPVLPGRVVVTTGGDLQARFVFHGITLGLGEGEKAVWPSRDLILEIMTSCFYHAESLNVRSIAFPLLGTGGAGFCRDVCLDTMFGFLARRLLSGLTPVRNARIILLADRPGGASTLLP